MNQRRRISWTGIAVTLALAVVLFLAAPALAHISVSSDPWTYDNLTHTPNDSWNFSYVKDPANIVFYGVPSSNARGTASNALQECILHIPYFFYHYVAEPQHVHIDDRPHPAVAPGGLQTVAMWDHMNDNFASSPKHHLRYFQSTFKDPDNYGWFTLSDVHKEWWCSSDFTHHVYSGESQTSGYEVAEADVWQSFQSAGHTVQVKDMGTAFARNFYVGHGLTAYNTRYAHYIGL